MNRIICLFLSGIFAVSAAAQSSLTLSFVGNGFSHTGGSFRYARDFSKLQFAVYGAGATGGILKVSEQKWSSFNGVVGISLNILPDSMKKGLNLYYGLSIEGLVHDYTAKNSGAHYTDPAILAGPHLGLNVFLSKRLYLNTEWGIMAGVNFGHDYKVIFGGRNGISGYYSRENTMLVYVPTSIGLTYRLGRITTPTVD